MTTKTEIIEAMARASHKALASEWMSVANALGGDQGQYEALLRGLSGAALDAALPLIREAMAEAVRPTGEPGNPHSYNPWDDDSIDPSNIDEVVHAAVSEGWSAGDWHGRDRAAHIVAGWEPVPAAQEGEGDE